MASVPPAPAVKPATSTMAVTDSVKRDAELREVDWNACVPKGIPEEGVMPAVDVEKAWKFMYGTVRGGRTEETQRRMLRCAVYSYALVNGTSRAGNYSRIITLADGTAFDSANIVRAVGIFSLRQFFRANSSESYMYLKSAQGAVAESVRVKAAGLGISANEAFATADWFDRCELLTPLEAAAHRKSQDYAFERSRRARGGVSLENVEKVDREAGLVAQGPAYESAVEGRPIF